MSCNICVSNFNKTTCSKVECMCSFVACKSCVRTYLLTSITHEPHCMQCRNKWSLDFVKDKLGASFVNGELKEHQSKIITDRSVAKREELLPQAIIVRSDQEDKKKIAEIRKKIAEMKKEMENMYDEIEEIDNQISIRNGRHPYFRYYQRRLDYEAQLRHDNNNGGGGVANKPKKHFIMPCQNAGCKGMLNEKYSCELCTTTTCSSCLEVKGEHHTCNPDSVESAKLLRKETRPCPKCGVRISKIDGCDQMWCIECKTAFSWNTGNIETGRVHNPHYFQFMRENGIVEAPQDAQHANHAATVAVARCGNQRYNAVLRVNRSQHVESRKISEFLRYADHLNGETIPALNDSITNKTNSIQKYEIQYILNEINREQLSDKLTATYRCIQKDQAFCDIYSAINMMTDQLAVDITSGKDLNIISNSINKYVPYFNMELIKALMLHDSKRDVELFSGGRLVHKSYKSKAEMNEDIITFSTMYEINKDK